MADIHVSASTIKDWLSCHKKVYYRITDSSQGIPSKEMSMGSAVHELLEGKKEAVVLKNYGITAWADIKKLHSYIDKFYDLFPEDYFSDDDEVEKYFKLPYAKGVVITGRMDRIHDGIIFDWKTSKNQPEDINRDPQFILYYLAYKKLYNKEPKSVVYVALTGGKLYYFRPIKSVISELEDKIIPEMVADIKNKQLDRTGLYGYRTCQYCPFKQVCWDQLGDINDQRLVVR